MILINQINFAITNLRFINCASKHEWKFNKKKKKNIYVKVLLSVKKFYNNFFIDKTTGGTGKPNQNKKLCYFFLLKF